MPGYPCQVHGAPPGSKPPDEPEEDAGARPGAPQTMQPSVPPSVEERLTAGDTDAQVVDFIVARYGEFVLLRPRLEAATWLLWFGPALVLLIGGLAVFVLFRRNGAGAPAALDPAESARLTRILGETERPGSER